jgi:DNA adenine methylase
MILTRLGNKKQLSQKIYSYFPPHYARIELFFGAGGLFFHVPPAKFNFLNDLDDDVTNLWLVVTHHRQELANALETLPISRALMKHWRKTEETDPILKALRFLFISNFTMMGKGDTLKIDPNNMKRNILSRIEPTFLAIKDAIITNYDFREVLSKISFYPTKLTREQTFIYMDPVYLDTDHWYDVPKWTKADVLDCFDIMSNEGIRCAMSEFDHPFVVAEAKRRGFNIINLGERQNIGNRRNEILITNYDQPNFLI